MFRLQDFVDDLIQGRETQDSAYTPGNMKETL